YAIRITAHERIAQLIDHGTFEERDGGVVPADPLGFKDTKRYRDRVRAAREKTGTTEAVVTGVGRVGGFSVVVAAFEFAYLGGSMGSAVRAHRLRRPTRDRRDDPPAVARRLPAFRVPPRARPARPHRRARPAPGHAPPPALVLRGSADVLRMTYAEAVARLLALRGGEH